MVRSLIYILIWCLGLCSLDLLIQDRVWAQSFPDAGQWIPMPWKGVYLVDPNGDAKGSRNVVSSSGKAAAFIFNDGVNMYFRMRLDDDPRMKSEDLQPFGWGVEIDTDFDRSDFEILILIDGISKIETVTIQKNTIQKNLGDPGDKTEEVAFTYSPAKNFTRVTEADTEINGGRDYFLDWYVSFADFKTASGVDDHSPLHFFWGSSSSATSLTENGADLVGGSDLLSMATDPLTPRGTSPTTGSVQFVSALDGSKDVANFTPGDSIFLVVKDSDLNWDPSSNQQVDVVLRTAQGDSERLVLTENRTGVFTAFILTESGTPRASDGKIQIDAGVVIATYVDAVDGEGVRKVQRTDQLPILSVTNSLPVLSSLEQDSLAYREGDGAKSISTQIALVDADDTHLVGAVVAISDNFIASEDVLVFETQNGITGVYDGPNGQLELTGTATVAQYQAALRSVSYFNSNTDDIQALPRTITFSANDQSGRSNILKRIIKVVAVNVPPVALDDAVSIDANTQVTIAVLLNDSDEDNDPLQIASATQPANGKVIVLGDTAIVYSPKTDFQGADPFLYVLHDGQGGADTATVIVTIENLAPSVFLNKAVNKLLATPGDTLIYSLVYANIGGEIATEVIIVDRIPQTTSYIPNTIVLNGVPKTDIEDADEVTVLGDSIRVQVGLVPVGASGKIEFSAFLK